MEGVHWSLYFLIANFTQPYLVAEPLALNCMGVCVLLTHYFQDNNITRCVIMDLLITTKILLVVRHPCDISDIGSVLVQYICRIV